MLSVGAFACSGTKAADLDAPTTPAVDAARLDARLDAAPVLPDATPANRGSLLFDGAGDFAQIPGTAAISTLAEVTVEAWVKPMGAGTTRTAILEKPLTRGSQFLLYRESNARLFGEVWGIGSGTNPSTSNQAKLAIGTWSHIALTYRLNTLSIYVNGSLVGSSATAEMSTALNDLLVGKGVDNTASFHGAIDELRIWNVARSQAQLQQDRSELLQGNEANLVGYWTFDEGSGDQIHDQTVGNNTGRLGAGAGPDNSDPAWSTDTPF
jgi:hypothetical protein